MIGREKSQEFSFSGKGERGVRVRIKMQKWHKESVELPFDEFQGWPMESSSSSLLQEVIPGVALVWTQRRMWSYQNVSHA